jgi:hypothetical protein
VYILFTVNLQRMFPVFHSNVFHSDAFSITTFVAISSLRITNNSYFFQYDGISLGRYSSLAD